MKLGPDIAALEAVLHAVRAERTRQERLKAEGRFEFTCADHGMTPGQRLAALAEELGEVARAMLHEDGVVHDGDEDESVDKELLHVAAIAVAWLEGRAVRWRVFGAPELNR